MYCKMSPLSRFAPLALIATTFLFVAVCVQAQETIIDTFNFNDGSNPRAGVIFDAAGNLYGTTMGGGKFQLGTAFELSPAAGGGWTETVLHNFGSGKDGQTPQSGLVMDGAGNLYGMTWGGGAYGSGSCAGQELGCGIVFELSPSSSGEWTETVLHSFGGKGDGAGPQGSTSLVLDAAGNLYGTAPNGGVHGYGIVFELSPTSGGGWTETILHQFSNVGVDGANPVSTLVFDAAGNLYGTTENGGGPRDRGTVFKLTPKGGGKWGQTVLHVFSVDGNGGFDPSSGVIFDAAGNLYGTTGEGGRGEGGTAYELSPSTTGRWTIKWLYSFGANGGGSAPWPGIVMDSAGNIYGTTEIGGPNHEYTIDGGGTVFKLAQVDGVWKETDLYNFGNIGDGYSPNAAPVLDSAGNLYGTTFLGGAKRYGMVYEVTP